MKVFFRRMLAILAAFVLVTPVAFRPSQLAADGFLKGPVDYHGSLEEKSQEAVIIMNTFAAPGEATEDLILRISVEGDVDHFAWVIPFPNQPEVNKADGVLFKELFEYVQDRLDTQNKRKS